MRTHSSRGAARFALSFQNCRSFWISLRSVLSVPEITWWRFLAWLAVGLAASRLRGIPLSRSALCYLPLVLLAVDARSKNGVLYDLDGDGDANDSLEVRFRTMVNVVMTSINEQGDIL